MHCDIGHTCLSVGGCKGTVIEACAGNGLSAGPAAVATEPNPGAPAVVAAGCCHSPIIVCKSSLSSLEAASALSCLSQGSP